ncbi:hypothetical protein HPB52_008850 [Rhipicephalus sanguineus]|uniref:Mannosyltransferase n=1 Tax=Rhipicephalus sanguineus TaxID=34632 RepID=A0A9D4QJ80_RHISA|nr:hypothetical protein HPB52_008850 [Rhipicephalus sanguineus]
MEIYMELGPLASIGADSHSGQVDIPPSTLCVGKEWYRFPSSFFLPQNWELSFIESEFRGQLPKPYASSANATRIIPTDMNDANKEERSRYLSPSLCDYLVDTDGHDVTDREPDYSSSPDWEVVTSVKCMEEGVTNTRQMPTLFCIMDIVLMAYSPDQLQNLLNI